jgi:hypothetical protein
LSGSIYYQRAGTPKLAKYELATRRYTETVLAPNVAYRYDDVKLIIYENKIL